MIPLEQSSAKIEKYIYGNTRSNSRRYKEIRQSWESRKNVSIRLKNQTGSTLGKHLPTNLRQHRRKKTILIKDFFMKRKFQPLID